MKFVKILSLAFYMAFAAAVPAIASIKLAPSEGVYHCAHPDFGLKDDSVTAASVEEFEALAMKKIVWSYISWNWEDGIKFPSEACHALNGEGIVPLVGIMPRSTLKQGEPEPIYTLERIVNGDFDVELARCAEEAHDLGFPIMAEFGPEVNGSWFPWNGAWNGRDENAYGGANSPDGPERFRDAYRHVVDIFRRNGASDVSWVFHIAAAGAPKEAWNSASFYYPGDDFIDWIGASVYGGLDDKGEAASFGGIMKHLYPGMCALSETKPLAILEMGVAECPGKPEWIAGALGAVSSGAYPRIKAVCWWNKAKKPDGTRSMLEIDSSEASLEAYREGVRTFVEEAIWTEGGFGIQ
jgi:hypothetical protein